MSKRSRSPNPITETELKLEIILLQDKLNKLDKKHPRGQGWSPDPLWDKEMRHPIIQKICSKINQLEIIKY
ncbi:hypothetical protein OAK19_04590 [Aureispira]|nr:hypothetical protein [Aureispira sp.]